MGQIRYNGVQIRPEVREELMALKDGRTILEKKWNMKL